MLLHLVPWSFIYVVVTGFTIRNIATTPSAALRARALAIDVPNTAGEIPTKTGAIPTGTGISIIHAPNGDIDFYLSDALRDTIESAYDQYCAVEEDDACVSGLENAYTSTNLRVQARQAGIVVASVILFLSFLVESTLAIKNRQKLVPAHINLPAADNTLLQQATGPVILEGSNAPKITVMPQATVTHGDILISTVTATASGFAPGDLVITMEDQAPIAWYQQQLTNSSCTENKRKQKRDNLGCATNLAKSAMAELNGGAFQSFLSIHQSIPQVSSSELLRAVNAIVTTGKQIAGLTGLTDDTLRGISTIILLISIQVVSQHTINKVEVLPASDFGSMAMTDVATSAGSGLPSLVMIIPYTTANYKLLDQQLSSLVDPTTLSYFQFSTSTDNFWDATLDSAQTALVARQPGVLSVISISTLSKSTIHEASKATQAPVGSQPAQSSKKMRAKRGSLDSGELANKSAATQESSLIREPRLLKKRSLGVLKQTFFPALKEIDLKVHSQPSSLPALADIDYAYPDLDGIDTWVYLIENGIDRDHPEFIDSDVLDSEPLVFTGRRADTGDPLKILDSHGTAMASKIAGEICGTMKKTKIILVAGSQTDEDIRWVWPTIKDDIRTRRGKGQALKGRTIVICAQLAIPKAWENPQFDAKKIYLERENPAYLPGKRAMEDIMKVLDVPIIAAAGNIEADHPVKYINSFPVVWANDVNFPLIVMGGVLLHGLQDPDTQMGWPAMPPPWQAGPQITVYAPSGNIYNAISEYDDVEDEDVRDFYFADGTTSLAAAAGGGTIVNVLVMNEHQDTPWFDTATNLVVNLWRFINSGKGSFPRNPAAGAPRVLYNMLDGSKGVDQCPLVARQIGETKACLPDTSTATKTGPSGSSKTPSSLRPTPMTTAAPTLSASCFPPFSVSSLLSITFNPTQIGPAVSSFCSSVLVNAPLSTALPKQEWNWGPGVSQSENKLLFGAYLKKPSECEGYKDAAECASDMGQIAQQCPIYGGIAGATCATFKFRPANLVAGVNWW